MLSSQRGPLSRGSTSCERVLLIYNLWKPHFLFYHEVVRNQAEDTATTFIELRHTLKRQHNRPGVGLRQRQHSLHSPLHLDREVIVGWRQRHLIDQPAQDAEPLGARRSGSRNAPPNSVTLRR